MSFVRGLLAGAPRFTVPLAHGADATAYPVKPIRLVVPFAPGGSSDALARLIGQKLGQRLGQPIVIENKPGAGTTIGAAEVAKAPADGYTLLLAPAPFVISSLMYPSLPYDPVRDFTGVALLASSPLIITANVSLPANTAAGVRSRSRRPSRASSPTARRATAACRILQPSSSSCAPA